MICKTSTHIIKDSNNNTYKFCLEPDQAVTLEQYVENVSTKIVIKTSVLDYSVDIDNFDRIHLIFVTLDGVLKYCLVNYPNSEKALTGVKSKNFEITNITLKIVSNDVHIFYMLKNQFNNNKSSLHHAYIKDSSFSINNIGYTTLRKNSMPYSINIYKNNLYLFYQSIEPNEYCIEKLSLSFNMWSTVEKNLKLLNVLDIDFVINGRGICVIFFNHYLNKSITTFSKFKDFNNLNNSWSESIPIISINSDTTLPSLVYKNNACFIFWIDGSVLCFRKSSYGTNKWSDTKTISLTKNVFLGKYITNEVDFKNNYLYLINDSPPYTIFDYKLFKETDTDTSEDLQQKFNPLNGPLNETLKIISKNSNFNSIKDTSPIKDISLIDQLTYSNNLIEKLQEELFKNERKVITLEETLKENHSIIQELKNNLSSKEKEVSFLNSSLLDSEICKNNIEKNIVELENIKSKLKLKESEIINLDTSYKNLVTEKDLVINDLKNKILELEKVIDENKNKGFFNLFK